MRESQLRLPACIPPDPSASYQCLLASAVQQVDKVAAIEQLAEEAALSLGQRERIAALAAETRTLRSTLVAATDARARALLAPQTTWLARMKAHVATSVSTPLSPAMTWEPALREARNVLAEAADCMRTLGTSLPAGGAAARLASEVDDVLRRHREAFGAEITRGAEMTRWAA